MNEVAPIEHEESLYARSVLLAFGHGHDIGVTYNNIILSSEDPNIIDVYDRTISTLMHYAVLYWPGGNPGHGRQLEAIVQGEILSAKHQADRVKETILGAYVGEAALARVPVNLRDMWDATDTHAPGHSTSAFKERCEEISRPFAVCTISNVTSGAPSGRMIHFWHPSMVHPDSALAELKGMIQKAGD